jgi:uncharacterized protein (DUF1499 family)
MVIPWRGLLVIAGLVAVALIGPLVLLSIFQRRPSSLGAVAGRLAPCPDSPNCVSSQAGDPLHQTAPLPYSGRTADALARLRRIVEAMPRATVIAAKDDYLYVEFRSRLFRFVDDVEFLAVPAEQVIHIRAAARAGMSDFGINRQRLEAIRREFLREPSGDAK